MVGRVVSSEISGNFHSGNLVQSFRKFPEICYKDFFHVRFNYKHIKINNKHAFDQQLSKSLCFNFMHYVPKI